MKALRESKTVTQAIPYRRRVLFAVVVALVALPAAAIGPTEAPEAATGEAEAVAQATHLSEEVRAAVKKVVVLPGRGSASEATTGSYQKQTAGLYEGMDKGRRMGGVRTEIGPVSTRVVIPILTIPGTVVGGISGATQRKIQEFRDRLTEDLERASSEQLTNDALASDVFWGLRRLPNLDSKVFALTTPVPEDTDAILHVGFEGITIDIDGKDAVITTTANAVLRRQSDGEHLYEENLAYRDRDALDAWTRDNNALWHDYANYARHYLGREIAARAFDRVELRHELKPLETASVKRAKKDDWQAVSKSPTPTLAWELTLLGGDAYGEWVSALEPSDISYDLEIYDMQRLVYSAKQLPQSSHTVEEELPCKPLRWSVRPSYRVPDGRKFGEWMRFSSDTHVSKANEGRRASEAPAYIQDFASLTLKCRRR